MISKERDSKMNILWTDGVVIKRNELGVVLQFFGVDELVVSLGMSENMFKKLKKEMDLKLLKG